MATLTSQLILSLIDKVTAPARGIAGAVDSLQGRLEDNNRRLDAMRGRMVEAAAVAYGLARAVSAPVQAAMEFESAMADVRKVVDFPTPAAFKEMSAQIIEMSTRIPIAATGIADIVAAAGQAGMAGDELLAFSEMAAKVGVAFDMTAGEVGEALAKIKTQLNISVADTGALADAINHLSNTSASAAPDLIAFMKRVAATGEQYGFTAAQTAAIGSAMIAAGAEAEVAATSFRNMGRALAKGGSATARQASAFKRLGLDVTEVAKRFNDDAVGTLRDVIVRINSLPDHLRPNTLSEIFGDEARSLAPLITQIELYDSALASVADQASYFGSSQREFEVRSETTANALQLLRNTVSATGIALGSALLPAINSIAQALGPVILAFARFADQNPRLTATVVALAAGLVGLRVAAIAAQFAFLWMRGGVIAAGIAGLKGLQVAAKLASLAFWPLTASLRATRTAMVGFTAAAAIGGSGSALKIMAGSILGLLNPLRLVRAAMVALKVAVIGTGIGAILVGIAAAGTAIYNNWAGIKEMFAGIAEGISSAFPAIAPIIDTVSAAASTLFGWFNKLTGPIEATSAEWRAFGLSVGTAIGGVIADVSALPGRIYAALMNGAAALRDAGVAMMNMLLDGLKSGAAAVVDYVAAIASSIRDAVSGAASGAWSSVKGAVGLGSSANIEARAAGGPVVGGRTYLVGEEGPELFTAPRGGHIIPNGGTAATSSSAGAVSVTFGNIIIQNASNAEQIARELGQRLKDEFAGGHWNGGYRVA